MYIYICIHTCIHTSTGRFRASASLKHCVGVYLLKDYMYIHLEHAHNMDYRTVGEDGASGFRDLHRLTVCELHIKV